jgi:4a-hydroxytetrahydrobiopterin dehydratase
MELAQRRRAHCRGSISALKEEVLLQELQNDWKMINEHHFQKEHAFHHYQGALRFTNLIENLAESEGHHPELGLYFRSARVSYWMQKIDGLMESDSIKAAKSDEIHANEFPAT